MATGMIKLGLGEEKEVDAVELLQRAFVRTAVEMERTGGWVGSTTACVAILQRSALHIVNVRPLPTRSTFCVLILLCSSGIQERSLFADQISYLALQNNNIGTIAHIKSGPIPVIHPDKMQLYTSSNFCHLIKLFSRQTDWGITFGTRKSWMKRQRLSSIAMVVVEARERKVSKKLRIHS